MAPSSFNPHPPLLAGETTWLVNDNYNRRVSIHTRHYWRVKRLCLRCKGGCRYVSIHTRHYWRVKRAPVAIENVVPEVSIHTRHYWRVKQTAAAGSTSKDMFQSTPAITGG